MNGSDPRPDITQNDRSVPRARRKAGDGSIDGRGRVLSAPAILSYGFRPFFLLGALYAALAVPVWLWAYAQGFSLPGPFTGQMWHAHDMIFGFLSAVIAGFILTAVPNWTGRLPLSGNRLAVLVCLWIIGRIACAGVANPWLAAVLDGLFPFVLAAAIWREVIAGRNLRNMPVAVLLTFFALAGLLHHLEAVELVAEGLPVRLALAVTSLLMALIGGRIIPSFTRNWLVKQGSQRLPGSFALQDKLALAATGFAVLAWVIAPSAAITGWLLVAAGLLLVGRLARWQGWHTLKEPMVLILHCGYFWLAAGLAMLGAAILWPQVIPYDTAIHTLTAGSVGTMTLAVMTRATLGHTGRAIKSDRATTLIYLCVGLGALLRLLAPLSPALYMELLLAGGLVWSLAFLLFVFRYGLILWRPKP